MEILVYSNFIRSNAMKLILALVFVSFSCAFAQDKNQTYDPDTGLSLFQLLDKYGYPLENHTVTTEDGYILEVHRIPHGRNLSTIGVPVFLMHGVFCGSHDWVNNGPGWSLGLILSDLGYDVWLGNQRGNMYSRKHRSLDPDKDSAEFFSYSFDEIGLYDVSASIDYILNTTGHNKLHYIGHSQGTTEFFALASDRPEYNEKVYEMIALAPVAYMKYTSPLLKLAADNKLLLETTATVMGWHEFFPHSSIYLNTTEAVCTNNMTLCLDLLALLFGADPGELDANKLTVYATNSPTGSSMKELLHLLQELGTDYFRKYDYGYFGNPRHYNGQHTPPSYNVSKITCPTHLFYSNEDALSNWENVDRLASQLPDCKKKMIPNYAHADYMWGIHAPVYVYLDIIDIIGATHKN